MIQFSDVRNIFNKYSFKTSMRLEVSTYTNIVWHFLRVRTSRVRTIKSVRSISKYLKDSRMTLFYVSLARQCSIQILRSGSCIDCPVPTCTWLRFNYLQSRISIDRVRAVVIYTETITFRRTLLKILLDKRTSQYIINVDWMNDTNVYIHHLLILAITASFSSSLSLSLSHRQS